MVTSITIDELNSVRNSTELSPITRLSIYYTSDTSNLQIFQKKLNLLLLKESI